ncbi:protein RETICULATA-RELATED 3, chloroplastic-like [Mangifera indica]|uniref:protein RETICULATA-RELATED 3, chloroplastic-like n=1 Tax=Mangifera indica TaxID=29780 RepID=UPI001CFBC05F|nr:protein RETICULATA-RELATED 3, chloroplastic-like [Mangifera indica]
MASVARLRYSVACSAGHIGNPNVSDNRQIAALLYKLPNISVPFPQNHSLRLFSDHKVPTSILKPLASTGGGGNGRGGEGGGGGGGGGNNGDGDFESRGDFGLLGILSNGWRLRVAADSQFPFKVLMEQLVGVTACVIGDMASRPNFGLNELDFVFSTLIVGSILNFTLMYVLAPTMSSTVKTLPGIFASCPTSHMFEPGSYGFVNRLGTYVFKGVVFAAVGFAAGLVGTAISNGLIKLRKKMDPTFETPNKPPPTVLNALTWALQMGVNSNFRYQTLNGIEFLLAKTVPDVVFKASVVVLRCLNNVIGGMTFVILARMTGSQSLNNEEKTVAGLVEKQKLVVSENEEDLPSNQST